MNPHRWNLDPAARKTARRSVVLGLIAPAVAVAQILVDVLVSTLPLSASDVERAVVGTCIVGFLGVSLFVAHGAFLQALGSETMAAQAKFEVGLRWLRYHFFVQGVLILLSLGGLALGLCLGVLAFLGT